MKKDTTKGLFGQSKGGYIPFARPVIEHLLQIIAPHDPESIYCYLLLHCNFSDGPNTDGVFLKRGEIIIHIEKMVQLTGWSRSRLYSLFRRFEQEHLLEAYGNHTCRYLLPFYEEHCGHAARKEEKPHAPDAEETINKKKFDEFFDYYHYVIHTPPINRENAWKAWQKLTQDEREEACRNLEKYNAATAGYAYQKLACNYLSSKSFKI